MLMQWQLVVFFKILTKWSRVSSNLVIWLLWFIFDWLVGSESELFSKMQFIRWDIWFSVMFRWCSILASILLDSLGLPCSYILENCLLLTGIKCSPPGAIVSYCFILSYFSAIIWLAAFKSRLLLSIITFLLGVIPSLTGIVYRPVYDFVRLTSIGFTDIFFGILTTLLLDERDDFFCLLIVWFGLFGIMLTTSIGCSEIMLENWLTDEMFTWFRYPGLNFFLVKYSLFNLAILCIFGTLGYTFEMKQPLEVFEAICLWISCCFLMLS